MANKPLPLRSDYTEPPPTSFKTFGLLPEEKPNRTAQATAITINVLAALIITILGASAVKKAHDDKLKELTFTELKPIEPIKQPKPPPPKLPPPPKIKLPEPKIVIAKPVELPPPPVPQPKMDIPKPMIKPAPALKVEAMAAPKVVAINKPQAASIVNHDAHPTPVQLGSQTSPVALSQNNSPRSVNIANAGMAGMPSTNRGGGPPSGVVIAGSGSPGGKATAGGGPVAIKGLSNGTPGGTGKPGGFGNQPAQIGIARNDPPPPPRPAGPPAPTAKSIAKIIQKADPVYPPAAQAAKVEGTIRVSIDVAANGAVSVLQVLNDLGYGTSNAARNAALATRFAPAKDDTGKPVDWQGVIAINFRLAGGGN